MEKNPYKSPEKVSGAQPSGKSKSFVAPIVCLGGWGVAISSALTLFVLIAGQGIILSIPDVPGVFHHVMANIAFFGLVLLTIVGVIAGIIGNAWWAKET